MQATIEEKQQTHLAASLRLPVGLAFFAFILIAMNDGAWGVLLPSVREHYNIDKAGAGLFFLSSTAGYLTAAFTSGLMLEKLGRKLFLALGAAAFMGATAVFATMPPFLIVLASLVVLGLGVGIIDAGLNAYVAGLPNNTSLLNLLHAFYGVGALIGPLVASTFLALALGWNNVYVLWAAFGLLLLIGFTLFYSGRAAADHETHEHAQSNVLAAALKLPVVWLAALFLLFYVGAEVSLGSWVYTLLTEGRHEATLIAGWMVSGYWLGLTIGRLVLARVSRRVGNNILIQGCMLGALAGLLITWLAPGGTVTTAFGLGLIGFSLGPLFPTIIAAMSQFVPARVLPSAIGFLASLGAAGAALFPWLAGNLAQQIGLWSLLPFVISLTLGMFVAWALLQRRGRQLT